MNSPDVVAQMVVSNLFLALAYFSAAILIVPRFHGMSAYTKFFAFSFLILCGAVNHLDPAIHLHYYGQMMEPEIQPHSLWGHHLQAWAALGFVGSMYRDADRGRTPFIAVERRRRKR